MNMVLPAQISNELDPREYGTASTEDQAVKTERVLNRNTLTVPY